MASTPRHSVKATRIVTKIGDIFEVPLDGKTKKYFQYVAIDGTQLNSSVIRAFKKEFPLEAQVTPDQITNLEVEFFAHTVLRVGIVQNLWRKVGKSSNIGNLDAVFRGTNDILDQQIRVSENWYIWKINMRMQEVGKLVGDHQKADIGLVFPAKHIVERMRTVRFSFKYPQF
jgi:hypothetical protein